MRLASWVLKHCGDADGRCFFDRICSCRPDGRGFLVSSGAVRADLTVAGFWSPGEVSRPDNRNASKHPPGGLLDIFLGQEPEIHPASWRPPGETFEPGARNASKHPLGRLLEKLDFWAKSQKCFKTASWRPPRATFDPGARNASKRPSGGLLDLLLSIWPERLQTGLLV